MQLERNTAAPSGQRYPNLKYYFKTYTMTPCLSNHSKYPLNGMSLCYGNGYSSVSAPI